MNRKKAHPKPLNQKHLVRPENKTRALLSGEQSPKLKESDENVGGGEDALIHERAPPTDHGSSP